MIYNPALKFVEIIFYLSFINMYLNLFAEISVIRSNHSKRRKTMDGSLMSMYWLLIIVWIFIRLTRNAFFPQVVHDTASRVYTCSNILLIVKKIIAHNNLSACVIRY